MATVLVTGGSGTFGQQLVPLLAADGHEVSVLSRRPGATHIGDLTTGTGVAAAVAGAQVVVHAASDTRRMGRDDVLQTEHLLSAVGADAHLVYLSIVGIDRIGYGYYKRKLACEELVAAGPAPWTIQRATQFHELLAMVLGVFDRLPLALLPLDFRFQTIAAAEVAERVAALVAGPPAGRAPDIGGPEVLALRDMAPAWRAARGRPERLVNLPIPGAVARAFKEGRNTCPDHADGHQTWKEFVASPK